MKEFFHQPTDKLPLTWIDVSNPDENELLILAKEYNLHPASVQDCLQPNHLPKYELIGEVRFIITRVYEPDDHLPLINVQRLTHKLAIFFTDDLVITIHRTPKPFLPHIKKSLVDTGKCKGVLHLVCKIIKQVLISYDSPAEHLQREVDFYEESVLVKQKTPIFPKGLYHLKQKANLIRRLLHFTLAIFEELEEEFDADPYLRDLKETQQRLTVTYDDLYESSHSLLNFYISLSSTRTNEVMRILTIFSAFFMPLTFIVGIYGMNFDFMPELRWQFSYPMLIILMISITVVIYAWFKRKGWM